MSGAAQELEVARAIALFLDALRKDYAVDEVRLYGSRARGDFRPDSDVDLAVVLRGPRGDVWDTAIAWSDITFNVLVETGVAVSALPLWGEDLVHPERARNPALIRHIRDGVRLCSCYHAGMDQSPPSPAPELAPPGTPPHVAVALGLRNQPRVVIRAEGDTDEDYEARSRLLAAALAFPADS